MFARPITQETPIPSLLSWMIDSFCSLSSLCYFSCVAVTIIIDSSRPIRAAANLSNHYILFHNETTSSQHIIY